MAVKKIPTIDYTSLIDAAQNVSDPETKANFETNVAYMVRDEIDALDWQIRAKGTFSLADRLNHFGNISDNADSQVEKGLNAPESSQHANEADAYATTAFKVFAARQQALKTLYGKLTGVAYAPKAERIRDAKAQAVASVDREAAALAAVA